MRQAPLNLGLCLAAALAGFAFVIAAVPSSPEGIAAPLPPSKKGVASPGVPTALPQVSAENTVGMRKIVPSPRFSPDLEDPCSLVEEALSGERCARNWAERELERVQVELDKAQYKLKFIQTPLETPYGAFLASPEAGMIRNRFAGMLEFNEDERFPRRPAEKVALRYIKRILEDDFPVFLFPGEAMWIAERKVFNDWNNYEGGREPTIIRFLGADRLAAELPAKRVVELREEYAEEGLFD